MEIEEFISRVVGEPAQTVTRTVRTIPPALLAKASASGGLRLTEVLPAAKPQAERREVRYRHILGSPASQQAIDAWQDHRPSHPLPHDLQALIRRINGIHLWADVETGRAYTGLAPVEEWELARVKMYGAAADPGSLGDRYVAISYHQDGAAFVVLDVETARYFLMDTAGPDTTSPVANNASELLDWLWRDRIPPGA